MLFFTKKDKLCPYCNGVMKELRNFKRETYWACDPCPALLKRGNLLLEKYNECSGNLSYSYSHYEYKKHPVKEFIQRFKDAVYVFKNGMD